MTTNNIRAHLAHETVWLEAGWYEEVENKYHSLRAQKSCPAQNRDSIDTNHATGVTTEDSKAIGSLADEIAIARERLQSTLKSVDQITVPAIPEIINRIKCVEDECQSLTEKVQNLFGQISDMRAFLSKFENQFKKLNIDTAGSALEEQKNHTTAAKNGPENDDDDDIDLFGSDEENEEDAKLREERLKAYESKKSKKPAAVAKSSIVLDVKPWDDSTDMKAMETEVRKIKLDGLKWGASKLVPLAYGINKLQIIAIVEDEKVSIDWLQETIQENEELVQSVDIAAFNKL